MLSFDGGRATSGGSFGGSSFDNSGWTVNVGSGSASGAPASAGLQGLIPILLVLVAAYLIIKKG